MCDHAGTKLGKNKELLGNSLFDKSTSLECYAYHQNKDFCKLLSIQSWASYTDQCQKKIHTF